MRRPERGDVLAVLPQFLPLPLGEKPKIIYAIVVSSNGWNKVARSATLVPAFDGAPTEPHHVDLGFGAYADPKLVTALGYDALALEEPFDPVTAAQLNEISVHLRAHLCIDQLKSQLPSVVLPIGAPPSTPRQGQVRFMPETTGDSHPWVVISSDHHNASTGYTTLVPMTSQRKAHLSNYEVGVGTKCVVVPNLAFTDSDLVPTSRPRNAANTLPAPAMAEVATKLEAALALGSTSIKVAR